MAMHRTQFCLLFSILLLVHAAGAQCRSDVMMTVLPTGDGDLAPAVGANVRVCSLGATGYPCNPLEPLYTDQTLQTVQPINPFTADSFGNIVICVKSGTVYLESTYKGTVKVQPTYLVSAGTTVVGPPGQIFLSSLSLSPASVIGPANFTGTLTLSGPAPTGGATVVVSSLNPSLVTVPANVTISASSTTGTFTGSAVQVATSTAVTIQGSYGGANQPANLTINPPAVPTPIYGGVGAPGATSATLTGSTVTLNNGAVLTQLKTTAEKAGDIYGPFNPSTQSIYLVLFGATHTFSDPTSGLSIPFKPSPLSVTIGTSTMRLYETLHVIAVSTQVKVVN